MNGIMLVLAGPCPRAADERAHTWEPGDSADLVSYGQPDHGLTVYLGRCRYCGAALLAVDRLTADGPTGRPWYEALGAEL